MGAPRLPQVVDEVLAGVPPLVALQDRLAPQAGGDLVHLPLLEGLPEVVRDVEHHSLNSTGEKGLEMGGGVMTASLPGGRA